MLMCMLTCIFIFILKVFKSCIIICNRVKYHNVNMNDKPKQNLSQILIDIQRQLNENKTPIYISNDRTHVTSSGGIIYDNKHNKILVVLGPIKWSLPKGHHEQSENSYDTAMREIFEETSIQLHLHKTSKFKKVLRCIYYLIRIDDGVNLRLQWIDNDEIRGIKWCSIDELSKMPCNKQLKSVINKWDKINNKFNEYGDILKYHINIPTDQELASYIENFKIQS